MRLSPSRLSEFTTTPRPVRGVAVSGGLNSIRVAQWLAARSPEVGSFQVAGAPRMVTRKCDAAGRSAHLAVVPRVGQTTARVVRALGRVGRMPQSIVPRAAALSHGCSWNGSAVRTQWLRGAFLRVPNAEFRPWHARADLAFAPRRAADSMLLALGCGDPSRCAAAGSGAGASRPATPFRPTRGTETAPPGAFPQDFLLAARPDHGRRLVPSHAWDGTPGQASGPASPPHAGIDPAAATGVPDVATAFCPTRGTKAPAAGASADEPVASNVIVSRHAAQPLGQRGLRGSTATRGAVSALRPSRGTHTPAQGNGSSVAFSVEQWGQNAVRAPSHAWDGTPEQASGPAGPPHAGIDPAAATGVPDVATAFCPTRGTKAPAAGSSADEPGASNVIVSRHAAQPLGQRGLRGATATRGAVSSFRPTRGTETAPPGACPQDLFLANHPDHGRKRVPSHAWDGWASQPNRFVDKPPVPLRAPAACGTVRDFRPTRGTKSSKEAAMT